MTLFCATYFTPMSQKKTYVRGYFPEYLKFGFIESTTNKQLPMCILCHKTFPNEAMKPSRLREHLVKTHPSDASKPIEYFQDLYQRFTSRSTITALFKNQNSSNQDGLTAAYHISQVIEKCGKSHNIRERLIIPSIRTFISTVMNQDPSKVMKTLPLSDTSVSQRIDEMTADVEDKLVVILRNTLFSIQLDESTIVDNNAILMAYVRYCDEDTI